MDEFVVMPRGTVTCEECGCQRHRWGGHMCAVDEEDS